jgi:exonuclease VII small subunit
VVSVVSTGPAVGGEGFVTAVKDGVGLSTESLVWRVLCFLALGVSVVAAICVNLMRPQNTAGRVSAAEAANAELDGLRTMLEFGDIKLDPALRMYQQSIVKVSFVDEKLST